MWLNEENFDKLEVELSKMELQLFDQSRDTSLNEDDITISVIEESKLK